MFVKNIPVTKHFVRSHGGSFFRDLCEIDYIVSAKGQLKYTNDSREYYIIIKTETAEDMMRFMLEHGDSFK